MPQFAYTARTASGSSRRGVAEAASQAALIGQLRDQGYLVLRVQVHQERGDRAIALNPLHWLPVRGIDIEQGLHQIAVMLHSGLTLLSSLRTAGEQARRPAARRLWHNVAERIQQGESLTDAIAAYRCMPRLVIDLCRVGEQTGTLDQVMARAAETLERRRHLRTTLITALTYPVIVVVAAVAVTAFMLLGVIPRLERFLSAMGRELPPLTQMLLDVSTMLRLYGPGILIGATVTLLATIALYQWPTARAWMDRIALRVPVTGSLLRTAITASFARTLGTMIGSGVTLLEGLRTVEQQQHNLHIAQRVAAARERVIQGGTLANAIGERSAFMPMLSRMVAVGESSGTLDDSLGEVARFHEAELQSAIRRFSAIIEPVVIIVVGGIVGFVYLAFFMALFAAAGAG